MCPCAECLDDLDLQCPGTGGTTWFRRVGHAPDVVHPLLLSSMKPDKEKHAIGKGENVEMPRRDGASSDSRRTRSLSAAANAPVGFSTIALLLGEWQNQDLKLFDCCSSFRFRHRYEKRREGDR